LPSFVKFFAKLGRIPRRVRFIVLPYIWPAISIVLKRISKSAKKVEPYNDAFKEAIFLRSEYLNEKMIGIDLTSAARSWIKDVLGLQLVEEIASSADLKNDFRRKVLIIDFDWIFSIHEKPFMFFKIIKLAIKARSLNMPVWVFLGDTFAVRYLPATCFLVAFCGGSIILQPNTPAEAEAFGIIFPTGPFLWSMSDKNCKAFFSDIEVVDRPKVVLLAGTGESRRINYMNELSQKLNSIGWDTTFSNGKLSWNQYVDLSKNVSAIATTNWMHKVHIRGTRKSRNRIAKTTTTHRVWEGFASGSLVMTQRTAVLDFFGFLPGKHYFELWSENDIRNQIIFMDKSEIALIANSGQNLFLDLVKSN
jgi:hypothetical protein